jgi:hypothetical protein
MPEISRESLALAREFIADPENTDAHRVAAELSQAIVGLEAASAEGEPAYTVLGFYLEPSGHYDGEGDSFQNYATSVYTREGPHAAIAIAQRVCREDNQAESGEDLLQVVAVIAGEHAVLAPEN